MPTARDLQWLVSDLEGQRIEGALFKPGHALMLHTDEGLHLSLKPKRSSSSQPESIALKDWDLLASMRCVLAEDGDSPSLSWLAHLLNLRKIEDISCSYDPLTRVQDISIFLELEGGILVTFMITIPRESEGCSPELSIIYDDSKSAD